MNIHQQIDASRARRLRLQEWTSQCIEAMAQYRAHGLDSEAGWAMGQVSTGFRLIGLEARREARLVEREHAIGVALELVESSRMDAASEFEAAYENHIDAMFDNATAGAPEPKAPECWS